MNAKRRRTRDEPGPMSRSGNRLSGAEAAVRMLEGHGVEVIFGLCGDTSLPFYDALHRLDHGITHVLTRDERSAAYMADGYARASGRVGVCEGPSGGGATYILPGVVEANDSSVPVLAITSDIATTARGRYTLTELDQNALFAPLTKWNAVVERACDVPAAFRAAFAAMTGGRPGAAHIGLPFDVQCDPLDAAEVHADAALGRCPSRRDAPEPKAVAAAADVILAAANPLFICGGGVVISGAEGELAALAGALAAPVATSISGQGAIGDRHPLALGVIGSNGGTPETRALVDAADLVVFVGCRAGSVTTERGRHPDARRVRCVHIDADETVIGVNYDCAAAIIGDARLALAALGREIATRRPAIPARAPDAAAVARAKAAKFRAFDALAASDETPIRPERLIAELRAALPPDAVVAADAGTPCPYVAAYFEVAASGRRVLTNRAHGALGYALPAAIGAKFARPGSPCVALMGDGSFGFAAGEIETAARLGLPVVFVVVSNGGYGWIKAGQQARFGGRYHAVDFTAVDHAAVARAWGVESRRVSDPRDLRPALACALGRDGPTLIDVVCQPLHEARAPVADWIA